MRFKYDSEHSNAFKCCFCCHVRVGTILLGLWHLAVHLLVLGCLITTSIHPELLQDSTESAGTADVVFGDDNKDGKEVIIHYDTTSDNVSTTLKMRKENICLFFALVLCTFLVSVMLVYGAVRSRPSCLMPFFCLQVFDFCVTCLWIVGYMTYAPDIKLWILQQGFADYPGVDRLLKMDEQWLMIWLLIVFVLILTIKAYLLNMVWSCYKYLQLRNSNRNVVREYNVDPDSEMLLPPKYEEAMKTPAADTMPPPYAE